MIKRLNPRRWRRVAALLGLLLAAGAAFPFLLRWWIDRRYQNKIYAPADVPPRRVAIVFGAGISRDGRPLPALADRVWMAALLYQTGKVDKLLMSGDNRFLNYNEPGAMARYAIELGVPEADIVADYAGRRTYDTCYRAGYIFGLDEAILVTQGFHLDRALYTCDRLGLDVVGVSADRNEYRAARFWWWRELAAVSRAWLDLNLLHPTPVLGNREPIFPHGS